MNLLFTICGNAMSIVVVLMLLGCGSGRPETMNPHHGAFFRTDWHPIHNDKQARNNAAPKKNNANIDARTGNVIRDAIVREALRLYRDGQKANHYGDRDIAEIFSRAGCPNCFETDTDAPAIVKTATRFKAYHTQRKPAEGDIILFHNQVDRNRNGRSDDWFTGAGIIVDAGRRKHVVVTRTGDIPRMIHVSPKGPMVRKYKGDIVNSYLRIPGPHDPKDAQYLSGQLYGGFVDAGVIVARHSK